MSNTPKSTKLETRKIVSHLSAIWLTENLSVKGKEKNQNLTNYEKRDIYSGLFLGFSIGSLFIYFNDKSNVRKSSDSVGPLLVETGENVNDLPVKDCKRWRQSSKDQVLIRSPRITSKLNHSLRSVILNSKKTYP